MNLFKQHIVLSLIAIGILTCAMQENRNVFSTASLIDYNLEESVDHVEELSEHKEIPSQHTNGNGNSVAILEKSNFSCLHFHSSQSNLIVSEESFQESSLFILYCCLKLDC